MYFMYRFYVYFESSNNYIGFQNNKSVTKTESPNNMMTK